MAQQSSDGNTIAWSYDQSGLMLGFTLNGTHYFYVRNLQGDIVAVLDTNGIIVAEYSYDAWGNITTGGEEGIGKLNPIRYRGYYYDRETGYYYCQSRYYNPEWCRWISADMYFDTQDGILSTNMYAYCQNDPVNRFDPTGTEWYHWAIGAGIVIAAGALVVVTAGGAAPAIAAVATVASGSAAATVGTTLAAGAFIGSSFAFGLYALDAAVSSKSISEFNAKGDWEVVAFTAGGILAGGAYGYTLYVNDKIKIAGLGHSKDARYEAANLNEKLAMKQVMSNPLEGAKEIPGIIMKGNTPWPATDGWVKMQNTVVLSGNKKIEIHFVYNVLTGYFDDFKFK